MNKKEFNLENYLFDDEEMIVNLNIEKKQYTSGNDCHCDCDCSNCGGGYGDCDCDCDCSPTNCNDPDDD